MHVVVNLVCLETCSKVILLAAPLFARACVVRVAALLRRALCGRFSAITDALQEQSAKRCSVSTWTKHMSCVSRVQQEAQLLAVAA